MHRIAKEKYQKIIIHTEKIQEVSQKLVEISRSLVEVSRKYHFNA